MKKKGFILLIAVLIVAVKISSCEIMEISGRYRDEAKVSEALQAYAPTPRPSAVPATQFPESPIPETAEESAPPEPTIVNQNVADLQSEVNPDIVGWLTIPNTRIDYPFTLADDNEFYLHRDIYKEEAFAGTLFMDYRCARDFSSFNNILYGHNMKNRIMFGDIKLFADMDFFEENRNGTLQLADKTYTLEIFAFMTRHEDDSVLYSPEPEGFFNYIKYNARNYREPSDTDKIITLSTCSYEFDGARSILVAALKYEKEITP